MPDKKKSIVLPVHTIRERLRETAASQAAILSRSVGRMTSYDAMPCTEYEQEVQAQRNTMDKLLYIQKCRTSVEDCIASGYAGLRYRFLDGHVETTRFRRIGPGRIRVTGLGLDQIK